jgi:hypothetical protein
VHLLELLKRYSKPVYQGRRLRRMVDLAEKSAKAQIRTTEPLPQTQRVDRRLSAEAIAELVHAYRDGVSTPELRRRYELSQGSVIKVLLAHGVEMRAKGSTRVTLLLRPSYMARAKHWRSLASSSESQPMPYGERSLRQAW